MEEGIAGGRGEPKTEKPEKKMEKNEKPI